MNRGHENQSVIASEEIPTELSQLLSELQADRGVQLSLELPEVRQRRSGETKSDQGYARIPAVKVERGKVVAGPAVVYRDASDVRTILSLTWSMMILAVLLVASGVGNIYQYLRRPDRIVVDGGTGRVLSINDRNYGSEEGIQFGPDALTQQDKIYITKEFLKAVYQVDSATRARDIERALTMMVPDSAVRFSRWMKQKGVLDQQKDESWQTIWSPMDVSVDKNDSYTVNVIGKQDITKVVNGTTLTDGRQLRITIKLVADNKGRADRNLRSGFLISKFDDQELNVPVNSGAEHGATAAGNGSISPVTALQNP